MTSQPSFIRVKTRSSTVTTAQPSHVSRFVTGAALLSVLALVGCGSAGSANDASPSSAATAEATGPDGTQSSPAPGNGGRGFPGANGEVVAITGTTAQVRNQQSGQVAVSWTDATTFTTTADAALADVVVGDCVVALGADTTAGTAATSITITKPLDGSCDAGGPGGFGGRGGSGAGGGFPGGSGGGRSGMSPPAGMPSGAPTGMPGGVPSGGLGGDSGGSSPSGAIVIGTVTSVEVDGLVVDARSFRAPGGAPGQSGGTAPTQSPTATPSATVESVRVAVNTDTKITTPAAADASAMTVGACVTALGDSDDVGAISATSISVSPKGDAGCGVVGFGDFPGAGAQRPTS